jgi:hypothetical protein
MKRLEPEALVCLVDATGGVVFCTVSTKAKPNSWGRKDEESNAEFSQLYEDSKTACVNLYLAQVSEDLLRPFTKWVAIFHNRDHIALVEFPGVLLPAFKPTLQAIQDIKKKSELSMSEFLVPRMFDKEDGEVVVEAPAYTTLRDFRFNLKCLTTDNADLFLKPGEAFNIQDLQDRTLLDDAQASALQHGLTRQLALIQGPPGTGKSYVGIALTRVLIANKCK